LFLVGSRSANLIPTSALNSSSNPVNTIVYVLCIGVNVINININNYYYASTYVGRGHYEMMAGVSPSVCHLPRPNSRTERPRKPKMGRMEAWKHGLPVNLFRGQKVKGQSVSPG